MIRRQLRIAQHALAFNADSIDRRTCRLAKGGVPSPPSRSFAPPTLELGLALDLQTIRTLPSTQEEPTICAQTCAASRILSRAAHLPWRRSEKLKDTEHAQLISNPRVYSPQVSWIGFILKTAGSDFHIFCRHIHEASGPRRVFSSLANCRRPTRLRDAHATDCGCRSDSAQLSTLLALVRSFDLIVCPGMIGRGRRCAMPFLAAAQGNMCVADWAVGPLRFLGR
jgi:hypothetical protein